ncbi:MBL fold metallo-hydrolase RNA specificity domain-containing protein [Pedobacter heparinus]|uniref:Beta-lactamase domain protein n=1 Tax=Pedobacter heparinus (strain ATCC 13125 / DSM 2366 / CIP 104194 / JCM 7457 / NBRC 12017 / NCIMB 9290 / NRRL B-14731 / HIM 762-3) TaxID=485917 RepID=C6XY62_PEDHD|nr:MBL fold metallo-hydrolase [Pedobacter heparinus]ACU02329.1 beta-lactamase domain protein [Pedobacter heparinus DSM 2366]
MKIAFHGAARAVTGSKHLITLDKGVQILLDCGLFQGMGDLTDGLNESFGFNPAKVTYMILSHAHIDHCGLLPRLVAEGFRGPVYCTPATRNLARILLLDSAKIQMQDAEYANKKIRRVEDQEMPLYTDKDVEQTLSQFKTIPYDQDFNIDPDVTLRFTDAGHIVGSAAVHLQLHENGTTTRITFSGDVGRYGDLLLKSPQTFPQADYILMESTYGDSLHADLDPIEDMLLQVITRTCIEKKGKVIIPAFSVGRTQELLYALNGLELKNKLPEIPYYVDSPLSMEATEVLRSHPEVYNNGVKEILKVDQDIFGFKGLRFIESVEESKALNVDMHPCVIISSSGMAEGGRVRHHIRNNISDKKNTILMVGYASPDSLAGRLMAGQKRVWLFGQEYDVIAEVGAIKSMSAHGDYEDLLQFLSVQDPAKVKRLFLVHGEYEVQQKFAQRIINAGFKNVSIPEYHQEFEL